MLDYEIKFLSSDNSLQLKTGDLKTFKYETKKKEETVYEAGKRSFCERRGGHWRAPRPRHIRQLESKLCDRGVVLCDWSNESLITIVFSTGAIAYLTVKPRTLDVTQILFDRYCVGKLSGQTVTGVVLSKSHLLFTHADRLGTIVTFNKVVSNQPSRISDRDPDIQTVELGGSRRAERKVSWCSNSNGVRVLVWGSSSAEPAPWSPVLEDLANLHLYQLHGQQVMLIAHHQLENETLSAELSHTCDNAIHIVEQLATTKNGVTLNWIRYEVQTNDKTAKLSSSHQTMTSVSLPAPVRVTRRSPCDNRLLVVCIDGSLHVIHHVAGLTNSTRAGFIATSVVWAGQLIVAAEEAGRLQCFDPALQPLHQHTKCLDLTAYSRDNRRLQILTHTAMRGGPLFLASFSGGPLLLLRITHPRLLTAWIRAGRLTHAVALLQTLDWETEGVEGLWAVNRLVCECLRAGLHDEAGETTAQAALGAFLAPRSPLGPNALRLAPPVHDLARKFFHHLLRRGRVEKALSLAVDLAAWDLFVDARWMASRRQLTTLAHEAAELAVVHSTPRRHESECSESCSECSSHSYSESDNETSASSEAYRTNPPPLPLLPPPPPPEHRPLMMPVITNPEPASTNSIRPNLHQYLERDNSIWNTDIKDTINTAIDNKPTHSTINTPINKHTYPLTNTPINKHTQPVTNTAVNKPMLNANIRWHSMDNFLANYNKRLFINNPSTSASITKIQWPPDKTPYKPVYEEQVIRQELPNNFYRYHTSINYSPSTSTDRCIRYEDVPERPPRSNERNKVKFADTVTIAVVPESPRRCPSPRRELADSLPLSPPHRYLAAFTPQQPSSGQPSHSRDERTPTVPPKIKVVHFGMV